MESIVHGADRRTGLDRSMRVKAMDEDEASEVGRSELMVERVERVVEPAATPAASSAPVLPYVSIEVTANEIAAGKEQRLQQVKAASGAIWNGSWRLSAWLTKGVLLGLGLIAAAFIIGSMIDRYGSKSAASATPQAPTVSSPKLAMTRGPKDAWLVDITADPRRYSTEVFGLVGVVQLQTTQPHERKNGSHKLLFTEARPDHTLTGRTATIFTLPDLEADLLHEIAQAEKDGVGVWGRFVCVPLSDSDPDEFALSVWQRFYGDVGRQNAKGVEELRRLLGGQ